MDNITNIGIAAIEYNQDGKPVASSFTPEVYISDHWKGASDALLEGDAVSDAEQAKQEADKILSAWFVHVEGIELTDRETATIESEVIECLKWENGKPKLCRILFFLKPRD